MRSAVADEDSYKRFRTEHPQPWCWACGRGESDRPRWWYVPWVIERSHIVSKPRIDDRRVAALLCSGCHKTSHGERIAGWTMPKLSLANLLWLKKRFDPAYYNRQFMRRYSVGNLPSAMRITARFREEYASRRLMS